MSYTKHPYVFGYTVTVDDMKDMDNGIFNNDAEITKIKNGQTTVNKAISADNATSAGDAAKLGGHPASDYATTATVTALADDVSVSKAELVVLGWNVPSGMPVKNTVENGVFTQKVGRLELGSVNYEYNATLSADGIYPFVVSGMNYGADSINVFCDKYRVIRSTNWNLNNGEIVTIKSVNALRIRDTSCTSINAIKAKTSGVYLYYELAEYKTYTLADYPSTDIKSAELQALGWCVPSEMQIKNTLANGVLTQRVGRVDLGSLNWSYEASNNVFYAPFGTARSTSVYGYDCYTSKYNKASATALWNGTAVGISVCPSAISTTPRIYVRDTAFNSADAFRSAVSGMYLYYELTTLITHNITDMPSQKSMISDEWDSSKTYAVGSYCIYQNALYECLVQNNGQNPSTATSYWRKTSVAEKLNLDIGTYFVSCFVSNDGNYLRLMYNFSNKTMAKNLTINRINVSNIGDVSTSLFSISKSDTGFTLYTTDATMRSYSNRVFSVNITVS